MAAPEAPRVLTGNFRAETPPARPVERSAWRDHVSLPTALFGLPAAVLYGVFVLWPMLQVFWLALQQWDGYGAQRWIGLENFRVLLSDPQFQTALLHSCLWEVGAILIPAPLGLALALWIRRSHLQHVSLAVLFFPVFLPATAIAALAVLVLSPLAGLLNTLLRDLGLGALAQSWLGDPHLALPALFAVWLWSATGVSVLLLWSGLAGIGREYGELAVTEGAGALWQLMHITLPALRRSMGVTILLNAALGAQVFELIFTTTGGGPGYATMTIPLDMYGRAFNGKTGQGAAAAAIQVLVGLLLAAAALVLLRSGGESFQSGEGSRPRLKRGQWGATVLAGLAMAAVLVPLGWLLVAALEPGRAFALGTANLSMDPRTWTGTNIATVWTNGMADAIAGSAALALGVVAATAALALPAAFGLAHAAWPRTIRAGALVLLIAGFMQPTPVLIIPLFSLLRNLGLLDTFWGIALPETARALPLAILLLWARFAELPREVLDASAVDGASALAQLVRIAVPLARPALLAVAVWTFITSWNEYLLPTIVSQDGSLQTVPTLLASYIGTYNTQFGLLAAGAALAMAPSAILYGALRRPAATGLSPAEHSVQ